MNELYFSPIKGSGNSGDKRFVIVLMSVGILILIFAVFNYINLTVAQAGQRAKRWPPAVCWVRRAVNCLCD